MSIEGKLTLVWVPLFMHPFIFGYVYLTVGPVVTAMRLFCGGSSIRSMTEAMEKAGAHREYADATALRLSGSFGELVDRVKKLSPI